MYIISRGGDRSSIEIRGAFDGAIIGRISIARVSLLEAAAAINILFESRSFKGRRAGCPCKLRPSAFAIGFMAQLTREEVLARAASSKDLRGANLMRADLVSADLAGADLSEANLRVANLERADLRKSKLNSARLSGASLEEAKLIEASLVEASLIGASLKGADLSRADLSGADLTGANLEGAALPGAYLIGAFLNEALLLGANLSGAYMRMARLSGSDLRNASLEGADLSSADLSDVRLSGSSLVGANLSKANLSCSQLIGCDLSGADLAGANLSGCDLTGAKLCGIKFDGAILEDAWADWVDVGGPGRTSLEEAFSGIIGKPVAEVLIEGKVSNEVWAALLSHMCYFQVTHPQRADIQLKALGQGVSSSALCLEADSEATLVAYFIELADIVGKGSSQLFEKLCQVAATLGAEWEGYMSLDRSLNHSYAEALERTDFWQKEKGFVILTGDRRIFFEATSSESLSLLPPRGAISGLKMLNGRFVKS